MGKNEWSLLSRFRRVVKKVKVILNFELSRWRLTSMLACGSSTNRCRLSFKDRPGLRACTEDTESEDTDTSGGLHRTISCPSEDDIDKRAELFIENFRRQLQIERQISLELKYLQANGLPSMSP